MFISLRKSHPILSMMNWSVIDLPAPMNLTYSWNFGSLIGMCLMTQIITGTMLAMHYVPNIDYAFTSCSHISRDVTYGWLFRNLHANGASMFFICMYAHIGRSLYYWSYFRMPNVWHIGVVMLLLTMMSAFLGYVLPWGQMSFWGATVITNLLSAFPYIGKTLVYWIWGGYSLDNATLNRFFTFHFIVPFLILALTIIHILLLHDTGSNNPLGLKSKNNKVAFHWFYTSKDTSGMMIIFTFLLCISVTTPMLLTDPENWAPANPLLTPIHIKPEWYFLWAYAILRSIPNKLGGVITMFAAIMVLFTLPSLRRPMYASILYYPFSQVLFWSFIALFMLLTWIGGRPIETPFDSLGQIFTGIYFLYYVLNPVFNHLWEKLLD